MLCVLSAVVCCIRVYFLRVCDVYCLVVCLFAECCCVLCVSVFWCVPRARLCYVRVFAPVRCGVLCDSIYCVRLYAMS